MKYQDTTVPEKRSGLCVSTITKAARKEDEYLIKILAAAGEGGRPTPEAGLKLTHAGTNERPDIMQEALCM